MRIRMKRPLGTIEMRTCAILFDLLTPHYRHKSHGNARTSAFIAARKGDAYALQARSENEAVGLPS